MRYKNNPANIRYSQFNYWQGMIKPLNGFCQFTDIEYGLRAFIIVLRTYIYKYGLTSVKDIITRFAPASENDTSRYIRYVVSFMDARGFKSDNIKFGSTQFCVMCCGILWYETNFACSRKRIETIISTFNLKKYYV